MKQRSRSTATLVAGRAAASVAAASVVFLLSVATVLSPLTATTAFATTSATRTTFLQGYDFDSSTDPLLYTFALEQASRNFQCPCNASAPLALEG